MTDQQTPQLDTAEQKVSFGFGWQLGQQLLQNRFDGLDLETVFQAIRMSLEQQPSPLTEDQLNNAYAMVKEKLKAAETERAEKAAELGVEFLKRNAEREGVMVTESGLQYEVLEAGDGEKPGPKAVVRTHYHGTFIDGSVFDSSVDRGEPAEFGLNEVIPGWTEIMQMMQTGSKWRVAIPSQLAYGDKGSPPAIPPKATLVFEIHLIDIVE